MRQVVVLAPFRSSNLGGEDVGDLVSTDPFRKKTLWVRRGGDLCDLPVMSKACVLVYYIELLVLACSLSLSVARLFVFFFGN